MESSSKESLVGENWSCQKCSFENSNFLRYCEMCDAKRSTIPEDCVGGEKTMKKGEEKGFSCHACGEWMETLKPKCEKCGEVLLPEEDQPLIREKKTEIVYCEACGCENDVSNEQCAACQHPIYEKSREFGSELPERSILMPRRPTGTWPKRAKSMRYCRFCRAIVSANFLDTHEEQCFRASRMTVIRTWCSYCYQKLQKTSAEEHQKNCKEKQQFFSQESPTLDRLTPLQIDTIFYMQKKSQDQHWRNERALIQRIKKFGEKEQIVQSLHHYIVNFAPIIIHMHVNKHMQFFVKDTHYRNQFETRKSSGCLSTTCRTDWEDRMFDRMHHSASPFQRVKYGTINFTNDPKGVRACSSYGQSYFLLKPHVRNRCTVTDMDSSSPSASIGTFQFCFHILNKLSDSELRAAIDASKGNEVKSGCISAYKEIQIHGPVEFKKDVERVYVSRGELADSACKKMTDDFCAQNELELEIFDFEERSAGMMPRMLPAFEPMPAPKFVAPRRTEYTAHLFAPPAPLSRPPERQRPPSPKFGVDYI